MASTPIADDSHSDWKAGRPFLTITAVLLAILTGCGNVTSQSTAQEETRPPKHTKNSATAFQSPFGSVLVHSLTDEELKQLHEEKALQVPLPVHATSALGVKAYRVGTQILIEPKLLFRGLTAATSKDRERVIVRGAVALVDGLSPHVSTGLGAVPVPTALLIHDRPGFLAFLKKEIGQEPSFTSQLPCPTTLTLATRPKDLVGGVATSFPMCVMNTFYPVELRVSHEQWKDLRTSLLRPPRIDAIQASSLSASIVVHSVELKIFHTKTRRRLEETLDSKGLLAIGVVRQVVAQVVGEVFQSLQIPSAIPSTEVQNELIRSFFSRRECALSGGCYTLVASGGAAPKDFKFHLQYEVPIGQPVHTSLRGLLLQGLVEGQEIYLKPEMGNALHPPKLGFTNRLSLTAGEGDLIELDFSRAEKTEVETQTKVETIHRPTCKAPYSVCKGGNWTCTSLEVEKVPRSYCKNSRQECAKVALTKIATGETWYTVLPEGHPKRTDLTGGEFLGLRSRCVEIVDFCLSWGVAYDEKRVCERLPVPAPPSLPYRIGSLNVVSPFFRWDCTSSEENLCDEGNKEDLWSRVTTYSDPHLTSQLKPVAITKESASELVAGLDVGFSWTDAKGPNEVRCPLKALSTISADGKVLLEIGNTPGCSPFNEENRRPGTFPSLSIHNRAFLKDEFRCGQLIENWDGKRRYVCRPPDAPPIEQISSIKADEELLKQKRHLGIHLPFFPRLLLKGSLKIVRQNSIFGGEK